MAAGVNRAFGAIGLAALLGCAACTAVVDPDPLVQARNANQAHHVSERFERRPVVVDDPWGFETARMFFDASETLVVAEDMVEAQLRAASIAVVAHAPLLVYTPQTRERIVAEVQRLKTHTVLTVGDVAIAQTSGSIRVIRDPGGFDALGTMTTLRFDVDEVATPANAAGAVAGIDPTQPTWLRATWAEPVVMPNAAARPFPIHSRRDADMAPVVVATAETSIPAVANARSFGARVTMVDEPDPTKSRDTLLALAGLAHAPLIALGNQLGSSEGLSEKIMRAEVNY
ncbi:hypothetical protein [Corynebacterium sp. LK2510]|uniref:hypothetical protein n=1 Tax=Corynebacterium sp. LK2510 TaxID=3110472 RepID=UPI0034CDB549